MAAKLKPFFFTLTVAVWSISVPQAHCERQVSSTRPSTFGQPTSGQGLPPPLDQRWPTSSSSSGRSDNSPDTFSFPMPLSPVFDQLPQQSPPASPQLSPPSPSSSYEGILYPSCVQEYAQLRASCAGDIRMSIVIRRIMVGAGCCRAIRQVNRDCSTPFFEQVSQQYCASVPSFRT